MYEGFSKDLMDRIAFYCKFKYEIIIGKESGKEDPVTKQWSGMIGEIVNKVSSTKWRLCPLVLIIILMIDYWFFFPEIFHYNRGLISQSAILQ